MKEQEKQRDKRTRKGAAGLRLKLIFSLAAMVFGSAPILFPGPQLSAGLPVQSTDDRPLSDDALRQIQSLMDEKQSRSPAQQKLDSQLLYSIKMKRGESVAENVPALVVDMVREADGRARVDITAGISGDLMEELEARGCRVLGLFPRFDSVRALVPFDQLEAIAALPEVRFIQPEQQAITSRQSELRTWELNARAARVRDRLPEALRHIQERKGFAPATGAVVSQGDVTHRAAAARSTFGPNGAGVRIGVLSDGVTSLQDSISSGDLPADVTVMPGQAGSGDEGTAMLEIVHDLAPGAKLFFATAFGGIASFAQNIRDLRAAGCDIIVDDVFYFVESAFHDGQTAGVSSTTNGAAVIQAVNDVTSAGALYFSSAGNSGNKNDNTSGVWEGDFVDGGALALIPGGTVHSFSGSQFNTITAGASGPGNLLWSDPLGASSNDYDLFVLNSTGTSVIASSTNVQNGAQDAFEQVGSIALNNRIVVLKKTGAAGRFLHLTVNRGRLAVSTAGQIRGHAMAAAAYACAATIADGPFPGPFNSSSVVETFSSDGPRRIFFNANGSAITPGNFSSTGGLMRQKPDITAADGVSVTGAGGFPSTFFGTSAAAPHAGAIAALLKSANPSLTPAQIRTALTSSAIDIEAPGVDRDSGAGIVMAFEAMEAIGATPSANLEVGTITISETSGNGDGFVGPGESGSLSIQLRNTGAATASSISAQLSTSTTGVTVTPPGASTYPDLTAPSGSAVNASLFAFSVAPSAPCVLRVDFNLVIDYSGGLSPATRPFSVTTGPPPSPVVSITSTLDSTPPASGTSFSAITGLQSPRLARDGTASDCESPKSCPGLFSSGTRRFDAFTFTSCSSSPTCFTVSLTHSCAGAPPLFVAAYLGSFNPNSLCTNYLGDPGFSEADGAPSTFSVTVPAGASFVLVVHEVDSGGGSGCQYTLQLSTSCTPCLAGCTFSVNPTTDSFPASGGTDSILVSAPDGCQWTAASNRPWLTIDSGSGGSGDGTVNYSVEANPGPARSGAITVAGEVVDVDQASGCAFTIDPTSQSFGAGGGTGNVAVSATDAACEWTATSNDNWITITSPAGGNGSGNGSVDYSVSANNGTSRSGAVTIAGHTFTVTQGANCTFSINPANKSFDATGGSDCVTLTATDSACSWTATSNASWIDITSGSSGSGNGSICYSVENNPGTTPRSGAIAIAGLTFTVNQNADTDGDGIPDVVEPAEGRNPLLKDNDIFGNARLFAMQQYRDFLGREGDAGGISFWASEIQSGNRTRVQVIDNFFSSAEFQNSTAPVTRLYFAYFLRIPDFGGLTFWTGQLKAGVPLQNISQAFAQSAEFIARYGSLNNNDFVALVYNNVLGRAPDPGGLAFWKGQLDSGAMTRGQVMLAFSESTEFRALIFNEVFITQIYVGMLRRSPDQGGFDFWVSQLDSGVPRLALIEGFFSSTEYHDRFLPHIP